MSINTCRSSPFATMAIIAARRKASPGFALAASRRRAFVLFLRKTGQKNEESGRNTNNPDASQIDGRRPGSEGAARLSIQNYSLSRRPENTRGTVFPADIRLVVVCAKRTQRRRPGCGQL